MAMFFFVTKKFGQHFFFKGFLVKQKNGPRTYRSQPLVNALFFFIGHKTLALPGKVGLRHPLFSWSDMGATFSNGLQRNGCNWGEKNLLIWLINNFLFIKLVTG